MLVSVASIAVNLAAALALMRWTGMGHAGLALSTSVVALFGAGALFAVLRVRVGGIHEARLRSSALRILAASALMGVVCRASSYGVHLAAGAGRLAQFADVAISMPLGVAVFYAAARALGVVELEAVRAACYTAKRDASRPEVGDPPAGNR
jgi:peptidoglycan biosynthesis protein MviN/MurJ (putative lipid II flippase)